MEKEVQNPSNDPYKTSRILYIIEAAVEYFISILVGETYFAKVAISVGLPDTLTNILSSSVALACTFRIISIFLASKKPVKRWVTALHFTDQIMFTLLYLVPLFPFARTGKAFLFAFFLLSGHILSQIAYSPKINWFMGLVDNRKRGSFTATKEIVSLLTGMVFSFGMGKLIDHFEAAGDITTAFILISVTIFGLTLIHTATCILSKEKPDPIPPVSFKEDIKATFSDKSVVLVMVVSFLYMTAEYCATPFYGTYKVNELGFSLTFNAIINAVCSVARAIFSRPLGRFADKFSFRKMLTVCYGISAVAFFINIFTVPSNGKVMYTIYWVLSSIALGGIGSGEINLIYDYVKPEHRISALAIKGAIAGLLGFLATLLMAIPVDYIRRNGNTLFGIPLYAQQFVSAVSFLLTVGIIIYLNTVVKRIKKPANSDNEAA